MTSNDPDLTESGRIHALRESVRLLAAPADVQLHWLKSFGAPASELVDVLDDLLKFSGDYLVAHRAMSSEQVNRLRQLLAECDRTLMQADYDDDSLMSSDKWAHIRQLAEQALDVLA